MRNSRFENWGGPYFPHDLAHGVEVGSYELKPGSCCTQRFLENREIRLRA